MFNRRKMLGSCIATLFAPFVKSTYAGNPMDLVTIQDYEIKVNNIVIPCSKIVNIHDDIYRLYFEIEIQESLSIPTNSKIHFYSFGKYAFTLLMSYWLSCIKGDKLVIDFITPVENLT